MEKHERLVLKYPVLVEGKYDRIKLSNVVASPILTADGFAVFNSPQKKKLLRRLTQAGKLILLTDVRGVLKDPKDDSTLISQIRLNEVPGLLASGIIGGGMIPKIECCVNALERGVHRTHILDGRIPHSILTEMLSHKGIGTMLWE